MKGDSGLGIQKTKILLKLQ